MIELTEIQWMVLWVTVILVCLSIIGGALGSLRGRAGFGAILSLLIGPLGWIIVLLMPGARDEKRFESNPFTPPQGEEKNPFQVGPVSSSRRRKQGWY